MKRLRTAEQAYQEILKLDPETAISERMIKNIVYSGKIGALKVGVKHLIDFDELVEYIETGIKEGRREE